jgi:Concanavalin A-like lectin/glucanases superfamily
VGIEHSSDSQRPGGSEGTESQSKPQSALEKLNPQAIAGLLAYWPLDEGMGKSTQDKAGAFAGTLKGCEWTQGVKGACLRFNGNSDFVDLGKDFRLNFAPGAPFTLAGWAATEADQGVICSFRKKQGFGVISASVVKGNIHGWVRDDTAGFGGVQLTGAPIKDGKWHHFALIRQPDGIVELFLDAVSQSKNKGKASAGPITTDLRALGSDRFVVTGGKKGPAYFTGSIDEVCLYNRVLSAEEIAALAGK